jgi:hypothetical protein
MSVVAGGSTQVLNSVNQTQTFLIHGAGAIESGGSRAAGASTVNFTGTFAGAEQWVAIATSIKAYVPPPLVGSMGTSPGSGSVLTDPGTGTMGSF